MKRIVTPIVILTALGVVLWLVPLVHFVPLKRAAQKQAQEEFNAASFAASFWKDKLTPAFVRAADANEVVALFATDPKKAREQFGRKSGMSTATQFFLRGSGHVVAMKKTSVLIALNDGSDECVVSLPTGLVFGNTLRDATGLLDISAFPNSQNFNDISTELNRIAETTLQPMLREQAKVGAKISFVGCAEIDDEAENILPIKVIPTSIKIEVQ